MHVGAPCSGPKPMKCVSCAASHYGQLKGPGVALMSEATRGRLRRQVDMFLPVSRAVAQHSALADDELPYQVLPNFVPDSLRGADPDADADHLDRLPDSPFALFVGDLAHEKGVDVLLEAHAQVDDPMPLALIGRPYGREILEYDSDARVLGLWPRAETLAAWRRCAFAVVPSLWEEPFGIVALEAMAMGKPVIASEAGGLADLVEHGKTGLLVAPGDVGALRDAMTLLMRDEALRCEMATEAAERVKQFVASSVVPQLEQVYRGLLA